MNSLKVRLFLLSGIMGVAVVSGIIKGLATERTKSDKEGDKKKEARSEA